MNKRLQFTGIFIFTILIVLAGCKRDVDPVQEKDITKKFKLSDIEKTEMITVPAGIVIGGAENNLIEETDFWKNGVFANEGRNLEIPKFKIGAYEVTQRFYKSVMKGDDKADPDPSFCKDGNGIYVYSDENDAEKDLRPVDNVSWFDAIYFCNKLSEKTERVPYYIISDIVWESNHIIDATVKINTAKDAAKGYRLPTEAEWEYTARGANPNSAEWHNFFAGKASTEFTPKNADLDSVGWYSSNTETGTTGDTVPAKENIGYSSHRVGLKDPISDALKIYDMSGNVWEWCYDWYGDIDATTPIYGSELSEDNLRVLKGGSWTGEARLCFIIPRNAVEPYRHGNNAGFRICCSVE